MKILSHYNFLTLKLQEEEAPTQLMVRVLNLVRLGTV